MTKEIQKIIFGGSVEKSVTESEFFSILKLVAPGTSFRIALEGILKLKKGALILIENENTTQLLDGGFRINARFTPQKLIELAKMDGAITLTKDLKRINYVNVLLIPNHKIKTAETGTRHKAAERTANQAGTLVVAISERKNEITLYYKNIVYPIIDTGELLRKVNEHIHFVEKQRILFDIALEKLNRSEVRTHFDLEKAIGVLQKGKLIQRIVNNLKKNSIELGEEATLIRIGLKEIILDVDKETDLIIRDYTKSSFEESKGMIDALNYNELLSEDKICKALNYETLNVIGEPIGGYRILSKTFLSEEEIDRLIKYSGGLKEILNGDENFFISFFLNIETARNFKTQIDKLKSKG